MDVAGLAIDEEGAAVGADRAREDLDEGALTGAVGAQQRVHLARADLAMDASRSAATAP